MATAREFYDFVNAAGFAEKFASLSNGEFFSTFEHVTETFGVAEDASVNFVLQKFVDNCSTWQDFAVLEVEVQVGNLTVLNLFKNDSIEFVEAWTNR